MSAPEAKQRKRSAVKSLRALARDVGLSMVGKSRSSDMTPSDFESLQKDVLAKAAQEEQAMYMMFL